MKDEVSQLKQAINDLSEMGDDVNVDEIFVSYKYFYKFSDIFYIFKLILF